MAIIDNIDRVLNRDSIGLCRKYTNHGVSVENRVMYVAVFKTVEPPLRLRTLSGPGKVSLNFNGSDRFTKII